MGFCEDEGRIIYIWIYTRGKRKNESNGVFCAFSFFNVRISLGKNYP